ncbi:enoyl-CoA hydratase/isomerase family protein [Hydrogenophaga taeniospiralis]|uniref:enoyl-CoA hydratase/isomerase family protein n=1 Tax=Hydrogenophaga taeniospiralis TaxID=65656 RepID=UPI001CFAE75B|nr:enoyl-CoA hydratase/isomerase family protein [Hydrogenophaga taeniospiralis]MCB4363661.1 enoyl-CoA hydratase/isomerase family protein [Hydrogenophaga taeniospiralis]
MTPFHTTRHQDVEHWTLNDPSTRNALSDAMVLGLFEACLRAKQDTTLRGIVLTGASGAFSAGGSLGGLASAIGQALQPGEDDPLIAMNRGFGDVLHALTELPQWLVIAVDGPAMGGGFGLVCCADLVIATERSVFATPEVTLGLPPAQIAPFVWQRLGDAVARQCLLSGARWSAAQAQTAGLVNTVVADDALDAAVADAVRALRTAAPGAVAATKQLLHRLRAKAPDLRTEAAIAFAAALRGPEAAAGLSAFAKKQPAPWLDVPPRSTAARVAAPQGGGSGLGRPGAGSKDGAA